MNQIIPKVDTNLRDGFSNDSIIDQLDHDEKLAVENELINSLTNGDDFFVSSTLAYMKSVKSLPFLYAKLEKTSNPVEKINLAGSIFIINPTDVKMVDIAFDSFKAIDNRYSLISIFHYLKVFNDPRINDRITSYIDDDDYLLSYNSRMAIGIPVLGKKPWWKFW